jgi:hypothetical protein
MKKSALLAVVVFFSGAIAFAQKARTISASVITSNTTWFSDTVYTLDGYVYVKNNATLTIQPGTLIKGNAANKASLIITRNGMINAAGTASAPIVFTSSKPKGQRATGDWGGIIILGKAPINRPDLTVGASVAIAAAEPGGQVAIEGDLDNANGDGLYGGTDVNHNSGIFRYVRLEYGGVLITPGNEINGITMGGVGKATQMDHIQVTQANDDGFEWFGGNVNAKYIISHRNIDDDLDVDFGFQGKIQFALVIRDSVHYDRGSGPTTNGFESDNDGAGSNNTPLTWPVFSNVTVMGPLANGTPLTGSLAGNSFNNGARIRRNSATSIFNSVFMGWPNALFIDGSGTGNKFATDSVGFKNNVIAGNLRAVNNSSPNAAAVRQTIVTNGTDTSAAINSVYNSPFNYTNPDFGFKAGSVAASGASFGDTKLTDPFFIQTTYKGAFGNNNNWTNGWANFNPDAADYTSPIGVVTWTGAGNDVTICLGSTTTIGNLATGGSGRFSYKWFPALGLSNVNAARPVASPTITTTYFVTLLDSNSGNIWVDTITVNVNPTPTFSVIIPASRCGTGTVVLGATASAGTINWYSAATGGTSLATGASFTTPSITATTNYFVDATANGCTTAARTSVAATVNALPITSAISGRTSVHSDTVETYAVTNTTGSSYVWTVINGVKLTGGTTNSITVDWDVAYTAGIVNVVETNTLGCKGDTVFKPIVSIVPVEFLSFDAKRVNEKVNLTWVTASEINNSHFEVERSVDNNRFEQIGTVKGNGTTSMMNTYSMVDNIKTIINSNAKTVYYRLKQIDYDGEFAYTDVRTVELSNLDALELTVYPNPNCGVFNLSVKSTEKLITTFTIYNNYGAEVWSYTTTLNEGLNTIPAQLQLAKGMYNVSMQNIKGIQSQIFILK